MWLSRVDLGTEHREQDVADSTGDIELDSFREEARDWFEANFPPSLQGKASAEGVQALGKHLTPSQMVVLAATVGLLIW